VEAPAPISSEVPVNLFDKSLLWAVNRRTKQNFSTLPIPGGLGGGGVPPLSHGYVHEPFAGAWQQNAEQFGQSGIFSAVYACISIIANDVSKLPPRIRRRNKDGSKDDFDNHPGSRVLYYPNGYQTRVDFWGQFMSSCLFTGNTYVYLLRDARGVVSEMHILDPRRVRVLMADDGSIFYQVGNERLAELIGQQYIPARDILHHRLLTLNHPLMGLTPLYAAGVSAMTGQTIQQNSYAFFANMSRASGVLTAPGKISPELAGRLKVEWDQNFKGGQMGKTAVLGEGMKWEPLTISAADAQLIEQLRWSVEDVARCFRVPTYMLTDASKISFKNAEQLARNYYGQTLQHHIESIEARIDVAFGLADDVYCEFDLSTLLRMEFDSRMTAYREGINSGVLTINEARRMEELPPKDGGDEPLVQMQYRPLSMAGDPMAGAAMPPVEPPPEPDAEEIDEDAEAAELEAAEALRLEENAALAILIRSRARGRVAGVVV
jgi:HK97 family phage portal protein